MFANLTLETETRRVNAPAVKLDVDPEVVGLIKEAWARQAENEEPQGHKTPSLGTDANVTAFHEHARAAATEHEPRLRYRKLSRLDKDKDPTKAFFAVSLWVEKPKPEKVEETPDEVAESATEASKAPVRRTTKAAK